MLGKMLGAMVSTVVARCLSAPVNVLRLRQTRIPIPIKMARGISNMVTISPSTVTAAIIDPSVLLQLGQLDEL